MDLAMAAMSSCRCRVTAGLASLRHLLSFIVAFLHHLSEFVSLSIFADRADRLSVRQSFLCFSAAFCVRVPLFLNSAIAVDLIQGGIRVKRTARVHTTTSASGRTLHPSDFVRHYLIFFFFLSCNLGT
ncbi:hypothetical protein CsSME_00050504 [Camellia sinensis var. sinensis]